MVLNRALATEAAGLQVRCSLVANGCRLPMMRSAHAARFALAYVAVYIAGNTRAYFLPGVLCHAGLPKLALWARWHLCKSRTMLPQQQLIGHTLQSEVPYVIV